MFGKKKKQDDGADAPEVEVKPKEAKPAKAKAKPKAKKQVSRGGPGFLAMHFEKFIVALVLAGVGYFIYSGFSAEGYPTSRVPEQLQKDAGDLMNQIRQDHWAEIAVDREVPPPNHYTNLTTNSRRPIDHSKFGPDQSFKMEPSRSDIYDKRGDPEIMAPEELLATNVFGPLAVEVPKEALDPFESLEDAEPIKVRKRSSRRRGGGGDAGGGGYGGGDGGYGGEGSGGGPGMGGGGYGSGGAGGTGDGETKPTRRLLPAYDLGAKIGANAGMGGMGGYGGGYGSGGGYGGEGYGGGMGGGPGMGGSGGMGGGPGMGGGGGPGMGGGAGTGSSRGGLGDRKDDRGPKTKLASRAVFFNAITALVPHKKMVDEYKSVFESTGTFLAQRDMPVYLTFEVQRVDVSDDPQRDIQENEWKTVTDGTKQFLMPKRQKWASRPPLGRPVPEIIDRNAVSPGLTMPIPPLLVRDYREFSKHPKIDWSWDAKMLAPPPRQRKQDEDEGDDDENVLPGGRRGGGMAGGGAGMGGGPGMGSGMGGGPGMGSGGGGPGMGGYGGEGYAGGGEYGSGGGYGSGGYGSGGYGSGGYGGEGYGGGPGMGGGMSGGMGGGPAMGASLSGPQPEYKMVRCYDMLPVDIREIGKVYRYRVRLLMRDPNYPEDKNIPLPSPSDLEEDVWARVSQLTDQDDARIEADPKARRTLRKTEWSEPSPPVRVQAPFEVFAGNVDFDGPRKFDVNGQNFYVSTKEAQGSVVVTSMDFKTGVQFAMESKVRRGSVLNKQLDLDFIVPYTKVIKMKEDHDFVSMSTVADIRGGEALAGDSRDDPQTVGGEMMILHRDGRIQITNDLDDQFLYRLYSFTEEKEKAEDAADGGGDAGGMGGGGYGGSGYSGASGG